MSFHRHQLEAFASHKMTASPMTSLNVSAGLVIPGGHNYGLGFEVGLSIVLMAIFFDRGTQAIARRLQPPTAA